MKLDSTAKGLVTITWHIYSNSKDEDLDAIRKQSIDQLKKTVADLKNIPLEQVGPFRVVLTDGQ